MKLTARWVATFLTIAYAVGTVDSPAFGKSCAISRQIITQDRKPAVAAHVTVRNVHGTILCQGKTDDTGTFVGQVSDEKDMRGALAVVDFPDAALSVSPISSWTKEHKQYALCMLKRSSGDAPHGKVLNRRNAPVENCHVLVTSVVDGWQSNWILNDSQGAMVPELSANTSADGSYSIPSFTIEDSIVGADLVATATVNGATETAALYSEDLSAPIDITLFPTTKVTGVVVDATNSHPLEGVQLSFTARTANGDKLSSMVPPTITDQKGQFSFKDVPLQGTLTFTGKRDGYVYRNLKFSADKPASVHNIHFPLVPLINVSGSVLDEATGKPVLSLVAYSGPATPMQVSASNSGVEELDSHFTTRCDVQPDGTFTLKVPAGANQIGVACYAYRQDKSPTLNIKGPQNCTLKVHKLKGFMIHFKTAKPESLSQYVLERRNVGEHKWLWEEFSNEYLFLGSSFTEWGDKIEIQIKRRDNNEVVMPSKVIVAAEDNWITEIPLP